MSQIRRCLGKLPPKLDPRTLMLARYSPPLPPAPPSRKWSTNMRKPWGHMCNDTIGDCAEAAPAHLIQTWTAAHGEPTTVADADVVAFYSLCTGYDPKRPETDQGSNMLDVLKRWRTNGLAGHKIEAFAKVDHANIDHIKFAINMFGGLYVGANLPLSAQDAKTWTLARGPRHPDDTPGSWGGHAMAMVDYDRSSVTFVTWGYLQVASWEWVLTYVDELYAAIAPEWVDPAHAAASGFDYATMRSDLSRVA